MGRCGSSPIRPRLPRGPPRRVFRGLSLGLDGTVERLKDTNFTYFTYFSISYRFGSRFANVVNSRMPNIGSNEF